MGRIRALIQEDMNRRVSFRSMCLKRALGPQKELTSKSHLTTLDQDLIGAQTDAKEEYFEEHYYSQC